LEGFNITDRVDHVDLSWSTFAEVRSLGFEIVRMTSSDTSTISTWSTDPMLRSTSGYGANYRYSDQTAPAGQLTYQLSERSTDGAVMKLADRTLTRDGAMRQFEAKLLNNPVLSGEPIKIQLTAGLQEVAIDGYDVAGRRFFHSISSSSGMLVLPAPQTAGFFYLRLSSTGYLQTITGIALGR
jgi:hypothetical protein